MIALEGVIAHLQRQLAGEGDVGLSDFLLALRQQTGGLGGVLPLQKVQVVFIGGLIEGGGNLIVSVQHFFVGNDGGALLFQVGIAKHMVNVGFRVDEVLDAAALLFGEFDHLVQLGEPLGGVDEHRALAGQDHGGVAAPDAGEGVYLRCDLLNFNVGGADGVVIVRAVALPDSNDF